MPENREKILIRGVNWIGDAVLTIPSIRAIRMAYPSAHISLLVKPWVSEVFKENTDIDEVILYEDRYNSIPGKIRLAHMLRKKHFDCAILLQNAFDAALISWLAGIPVRIGYQRDGRGFLLTQSIPVENSSYQRHQVYYYLDLLKQAGMEALETHPYIPITDEERDLARGLLSSEFTDAGLPLVGINPGATYGSAKRWPAERFAELIFRIISEFQCNVILFGSRSETEIANEIARKLETYNAGLLTHISMMAGKTSMRDLTALIAECDAFITNDSGPMHIASALFVPVAALFGSTDHSATGPLGHGHRIITEDLTCAPCLKRECPEGHLRCMTEITADTVFSALKEIMPRKKAVFLDKDGTLIEDKNYLNSFDDLVILPGIKEGLAQLKDAGYDLVGITNQSGIARGIVDESFVVESNAYLQKELGIIDFYFCPHHPDEQCPCRKPETGLVLTARLKHRIVLKNSYVIGDKESDVALARKAGATGILLVSNPLTENTGACYVAKDMSDAVQWILKREGMEK